MDLELVKKSEVETEGSEYVVAELAGKIKEGKEGNEVGKIKLSIKGDKHVVNNILEDAGLTGIGGVVAIKFVEKQTKLQTPKVEKKS